MCGAGERGADGGGSGGEEEEGQDYLQSAEMLGVQGHSRRNEVTGLQCVRSATSRPDVSNADTRAEIRHEWETRAGETVLVEKVLPTEPMPVTMTG